jgi:hypothetical protein
VERLIRPLQQQDPDLIGSLSMGRGLDCDGFLVCAIRCSRRVVDIQMFVPKPSSLQFLNNHL